MVANFVFLRLGVVGVHFRLVVSLVDWPESVVNVAGSKVDLFSYQEYWLAAVLWTIGDG